MTVFLLLSHFSVCSSDPLSKAGTQSTEEGEATFVAGILFVPVVVVRNYQDTPNFL